MGIKFANGGYATLASSITNSDTSITLTTGQGARFPSLAGGDYFYATLIDTSNNLEIVKCTARSTDVLTVTRAQESTTARAYSAGDRIELRITAQGLSDAAPVQSVAGRTGDVVLAASDIASGTIATARLASGTASSSTYLRGDQTWASVAQKVVQVNYTRELSYTAVSAGTAYTVLTASITPTSSSNIIVIAYQLSGSAEGSTDLSNYYFTRNGTRVAVGNASGSASRATGKFLTFGSGSAQVLSMGGVVYDTPASTSALTYNLVAHDENSDNTIYINRASVGGTAGNATVTASFMLLLEVAP